MESPNTMFSTHCALHRKRKNTRRKWKHLEYGKNWLFIPNRLIWIIANKNVFSTTYSYHRNAVAGTSTERIGVCETVGSLSFGGLMSEGEGPSFGPWVKLAWSVLGDPSLCPGKCHGGRLLPCCQWCYQGSWPCPASVLAPCMKDQNRGQSK